MEGSIRRVPAMEDAEVKKFFNGPEAFTPDGEFILGESEVPGLLGRRGLLRARPRRRRRHRQGHGRVDRRRPARVGPLAHGHPPLRPPVPLAELHARAHDRGLLDRTTTSSTRARSARPGARCASRPPTRGTRETAPAFGEKSGWERVNWFEPNAAGGDESLRPRGWAGQHWSPAIEAECLAASERAVLIDQSSFAKIDVHGPGACAFLDRICANAVDRPARLASSTRSC